MTDYLTTADVLATHEDLIERFGGSQGIRDLGALESTLFRPQTGYYDDLISEAAALWESLSQNHPFIDGNKFIDGLYKMGAFRFDRLDPWLRAHVQ